MWKILNKIRHKELKYENIPLVRLNFERSNQGCIVVLRCQGTFHNKCAHASICKDIKIQNPGNKI